MIDSDISKPYLIGTIISRKEAMRLGMKQYFTGKPCKHGHIDLKTTLNGSCMECGRIKALKRMMENPEARKKSRETQKNRYKTDSAYREKIKSRSRDWHHNNQEKASANKKDWYQKNKDKAKDSSKKRWDAYREDPEWVENERARKRQEYKDHPHRRVASHNARRAREKSADGKITAKQILKILESQKHKCVYCLACLKDGYEVDHITPISKGGTNWPSNIQCLCRACNRRKSAKDPIAFANEKGLLL